MSNNQISPQQVRELITNWASANDKKRRPAEQAIEQLLLPSNNQIDQFMQALCQLLSHPEQCDIDVRTRICILLRKRIAEKVDPRNKRPIYCQLQSNTRQNMLRVLLKQLSVDPEREVRNQIADCITELSTRTFTQFQREYQNVQFMKCIFELYNLSDTNNGANDLNFANRINALQIFGHLCRWCSSDAVIKSQQKSIAQLYQIAFKQDSNRKVNIAALEAIQLTIKPLEREEVLGFIPLMFEVFKLLDNTLKMEQQKAMQHKQQDPEYVIDETDFEQTQYLIQIITQIACDQPVLFGDHKNGNNQPMQSPLNPYCTAFTQLAITKQYPPTLRGLALEFFISLAENDATLARKKSIITKSVINIVLDHFLVSQIEDSEWNELAYGEDEDHNDLSSTGEYGLDRLVTAVTADHVLPTIYRKLGIVNDAKIRQEGDNKYWKNQDWRKRHCAVTVITQISDHITVDSNESQLISSKCLELMSDQNCRVQYAAINAIGQLSNDHYDILTTHFSDAILKKLLNLLNTNNHIKISTHSCAALINFVPNLEQQQIQSLLGALLKAVMNLLQHSNNEWQKATNDAMKKSYQCAQEQSLTAIAALAEAAGSLFNQYYDQFASVLMQIVKSATDKEMSDIRCRAIECMGRFGAAVDAEKFSKHASELMSGTIGFFKSDPNIYANNADDAFIKTNISVWPHVLESIGVNAFSQYLPNVCEILANVAKIDIKSNRNREIQGNDDFDYDDFIASNPFNERLAIIQMNNGGFIALDSQKMENKLAALFCIDSLAENYGAKMVNFMITFFDILLETIQCKYSYELRSEAAKLSPRYIQIMIDAINSNLSNRQQLQIMSNKLMDTFISILDEGRSKKNDDETYHDESGESATIGIVAKSLLEFISLIEPIDHNPQQSIVRTFIDANKLEFIINCLFECVIRAQTRIEIFAKQENSGNYDAIAKMEFEEEKEFEDELLFNIAQILAEFIKIYKDAFLEILCKGNNMQKLLNFLNPQNEYIRNPQFIHKTGVYVICDIYEQCNPQNTTKLLINFVPQIFNIITNDQDPAVQQACFYCLGLMVNKCKNATINYIEQILKLCQQCVTRNSQNYINSSLEIYDERKAAEEGYDDDVDAKLEKKRQFLGVIDNAMATICKISKDIDWKSVNNNDNLIKLRNESLSIWVRHLPIKSDTVEGQICHKYLFDLIKTKHPIILGQNLSNLPFLLKIFAKIRNTALSEKELNIVVGEFAKTICSSQPIFAKDLNMTEKRNLGL